jgi:hypothetical protein
MFEPALFTRLRPASRVLVAGAGGGFDVYAGLPLALALHAAGKQVHLANLSFTDPDVLDMDAWLAPYVAASGRTPAARRSTSRSGRWPGGWRAVSWHRSCTRSPGWVRDH